MTKSLIRLTPEQDKIWKKLFEMAVNSGISEESADKAAWEGLCEQWPELRNYDGALPD